MPRRAALPAALLGLFVCLAATPAHADEHQTFPKRPVRLVAAQEAGSATDKIARMVAEALAEQWRSPVVVENRPGAGGSIGAEAAARAAPDGHTLLVAGYSNLVATPVQRPEVRYDPLHDFSPIARVAHVPFAYAVAAGVPARSLAEFVAAAKSTPGKLTYGSLGGGATALCMARFLEATGVDLLAVEYKGATSAVTDLVAGRIDFLCNEIGALAAQAQAGRIRLIALPSARRVPIAPGVPTTAEAGFRDLRLVPWYGVVAPADTPPAILSRIANALDAAVRSEAFRRRIEALGYEVVEDTPAAFAQALRDDIEMARRTLGAARASAK